MKQLDPETWEPPVAAVPCGLLRELPKKQRVHIMLDAGLDLRYMGDGSRALCRIEICERCGREKYHRE